eukprot:5585943-Prymnesium_polylepis.2
MLHAQVVVVQEVELELLPMAKLVAPRACKVDRPPRLHLEEQIARHEHGHMLGRRVDARAADAVAP